MDNVDHMYQAWRRGAIDTFIVTELGVDPTREGLRALLATEWHRERASSFAHAVEALGTAERAPEYAPGEVVPRLYRPSILDPSPELRPPVVIDASAVKRALIVAHGVELDDQLADAAKWAADADAPELLSNALKRWVDLRPLAEIGVVSYHTRPAMAYPDTTRYVHELSSDAGSREQFLDAVYRHVPRLPKIDRSPIIGDIGEFQQWLLTALNCTILSEYLDDLTILEDVVLYSNASAWLPSRAHLDLVAILAQQGLKAPRGLASAVMGARLAEMTMSLPRLKLTSVVELRKNSEILEKWRQAMISALSVLDSLPEGTSDTAVRDALSDEMSATAATFTQDLEKETRSMISQARDTFWLGVLGGLAGATVSGSITAGVAAAAATSATRAIGQTAKDLLSGRSKKRALAAARDHAVIFSEAG